VNKEPNEETNWFNTSYDTRSSSDLSASDWDDFLSGIRGGNHVQSSLWAQVNAIVGWQCVRLLVLQNSTIVAGAQVLFKQLSPVTAIGYVPKGPVFGIDDPELRKVLFRELSRLAQANRIWFLVIQPPDNAAAWLDDLRQYSFRPSSVNMGLQATVLIDLSSGLETILSGMKPRTRYNIGLSNRKGIRVREGTACDLGTYCRLLQATCQRQGFKTYPDVYFERMWEVLEPTGHMHLFLAEYGEEVLAAQLAVGFNDTLTNKLSVWSGREANRKPNEALQWHAIRWGRQHGYRYYNLEGIELRALGNRNEQHDDATDVAPLYSVSAFKMGFGGEIRQLPVTYEHFCNPAMRLLYDEAKKANGSFASLVNVNVQF
jgi:peptidoglycan pentaglycine glycine transferase (the first glycine)